MSHPYGTLTDINIFKKFIELIKKHSIKTFIETGTHAGMTTKIISNYVDNVITIDTTEFPKTNERLKHILNVNLIIGNSSNIMEEILPLADPSPILFFLDAHTGEESQILNELDVIYKKKLRPVIVGHDFYIPGNDLKNNGGLFTHDMHNEQKLSYDLIKSHLDKIYGIDGYKYSYSESFDFHNPFVYLDIYDEYETKMGDSIDERFTTAPGVIYIEPIKESDKKVKIDWLLDSIGEDKHTNPTTTSNKFKQDVWEFFKDSKDKTCVELGTHKGQTTKILSYCFKNVYTINKDTQSFRDAKALNVGLDNITYIPFDLYSNEELKIEDVSVFLIDAGHKYNEVVSDINRCLSMISKIVFLTPRFPTFYRQDSYIIFDDYGLEVHEKQVKLAIDKFIKNGKIKIVKKIGHESGYSFDGSRVLKDNEGLICKVVN